MEKSSIEFKKNLVEFDYDFAALKKSGYCLQSIKAFEQNFFLVRMLQDGQIYQWIYFHGFNENCEKFQYEITCIFAKNEELVFRGQVQSMTMSHNEIIEDYSIMMMPEKKYEKMLKFQVFLKNLKEEAKDEDVESGISDNEENEKSE